MIRATLDTNVLVSSLISSGGTTADLYYAWKQERYRLIISDYILRELAKVMRLKLGYTSEEMFSVLNAFYQLAEIIEPIEVADFGIDKDDLPVLGTAIAGQAEFLVTGGRELLRLKKFAGIPIIAPRNFLEIIN